MAHPHSNCPICRDQQRLDEMQQLETLISAMRLSAQDTLEALRRRGYEIVKTQ